MSRLRLYWPDRAASEEWDSSEEPRILPLTAAARRAGARSAGPVARARVLHENRCCPECAHPVVVPIELDDALRGRNHLPIPGTATLVGFHCRRCRTEWPAW